MRLSFLLIDEGTVWVAKIVQDFLQNSNLELKTFLTRNIEKLKYNCKHDFDHDNSVHGQHAKGKRQRARKPPVVTRQFNTKPLSYEQFKLLFPDEPDEVSLGNFDLTLLILVCGILILREAPRSGWTSPLAPEDDHLDQASDLKRMRIMRNRLYGHIVECAIPTPEFEKHWDQLVEILKRMGAKVTELDKIKLRECTKEDRKRCAKRITTLFRGDMLDTEDFANEKMKEMAENHKPKGPQKKKRKRILTKCHTEVLSVVEHHDGTASSWRQISNMKARKVLFACEKCCRFSTEPPKYQHCVLGCCNDKCRPCCPRYMQFDCDVCKGEIFM